MKTINLTPIDIKNICSALRLKISMIQDTNPNWDITDMVRIIRMLGEDI